MEETQKAGIIHRMEQELSKQAGEDGARTYEEWVAELTDIYGKPLSLDARGFLISTVVLAERIGRMTNYSMEAASELAMYTRVVKGYILLTEEALANFTKTDNAKKN